MRIGSLQKKEEIERKKNEKKKKRGNLQKEE